MTNHEELIRKRGGVDGVVARASGVPAGPKAGHPRCSRRHQVPRADKIACTKQRSLRVGDKLNDDVIVVVRGGDLDPVVLRADALRNHSIYGTYGIMVFAVQDLTLDKLAQLPPLVRFEQLATITVGALRVLGLTLVPTGRNPRRYDVTFDDLNDGVSKLEN